MEKDDLSITLDSDKSYNQYDKSYNQYEPSNESDPGTADKIFNAPMSKALTKFNKIVQNYKLIQDNLSNTLEDIEKLEKIHYHFVSNAENKLRFHEYGIYVDDIYFQMNILKTEYNCQCKIQIQNVNKLYKDLYRLFNRIVKKLISMKIENSTPHDKIKIANLITQERKNYFVKVKPFNEIAENHIHIDECQILYNEIEIRMNEFINAIQDITHSISNAEVQKHDGLLLQTFLISMKSEKEKAEIEQNLYKKLLVGILNSHLEISNKYLERTNQISKEILNDTVISSQKAEILINSTSKSATV
jgi:hypothetical protein